MTSPRRTWIVLAAFLQLVSSQPENNTNISCIFGHRHSYYYASAADDCQCDDTEEVFGERQAVGALLSCDNGVLRLYSKFCVTSYNATNGSELLVGGMCPYVQLQREEDVQVDPTSNYAHITEQSCGVANRTGTLCGRCADGYSVAVTDLWSFRCVRSDLCVPVNCFLYVLAALGPLTVMYVFVYLLGINVAAPYTFGYVTFAQIIPFYTPNVLWPTLSMPALNVVVKFLLSLYSIWSLEVFTIFVPPLCCSKTFTNMDVIALRYVEAVYPLVLVLGTYLLLKLHQWDVKPVVVASWPVRACLRALQIELNLSSLLTTFCTFVSLAFVKISIVSLMLLSSEKLSLENGEVVGTVLLYDGSVDFWGPEHKIHGSIAIVILLLFFCLPCLVLTMYPTCKIQKYFGGQRRTTRYVQYLTAFMEVFYGHFKDGTGGSYDLRFFGGLQFIFKFVLFLVILVGPTKINEDSNTTVIVIGTLLWATIIFLLQPYKNDNHTKFEAGIMLYISLTISIGIYTVVAVNSASQLIFFLLLFLPSQTAIVVGFIIFLVPRIRKCCCSYNRKVFDKGADPAEAVNTVLVQSRSADRLTIGNRNLITYGAPSMTTFTQLEPDLDSD